MLRTSRPKGAGALGKRQPLRQPKSLADQAADQIRAMIINGQLPSGEPLSEMALAQHLGVSKTPVREAFLRLKQDGLVETSPRRGTYVFEMDREQVRQLSRFRFVLERSALDMLSPEARDQLAADQRRLIEAMREAISQGDGPKYRALDTKYHLAIARQSGNAFLIEAYGAIAWRVQALLTRLLKDPKLNEISLGEHIRLTHEIAEGNLAPALRLLEAHILDAEARYLRIIAGASDEPPAE
jgi:DNA-binding GntR family transcriptional regulator